MNFSIPASYLQLIHEKLDVGLLLTYKRVYTNSIENDDMKNLWNDYIQGRIRTFNDLKEKDKSYHEVVEKIREYIETELVVKLNETEKDISTILKERKTAWRVERSRWKKDKKARENSNKILAYIKENSTSHEWAKKYKCYTLEEYLCFLEEKTREWAEEKQYFYTFPFFDYLTEKQKKRGILYDIDRSVCELIKKDKLLDYYIKKSEYLSDIPIYTPKKETIIMDSVGIDGDEYAEKKIGKNSKVVYHVIPQERISVPEDPNYSDSHTLMKTLDAEDNELMDYIMTEIIKSGKNLYAFAKASFSVSELATKVLGWHGTSGVKNVEKRLLNLVRPITYHDEKNKIAVTILDSCFITTDEKGRRIATVAAGTTFRETYIKNQLIYVARHQYNSLKNPLSKHICYSLQRDRVAFASFNLSLEKNYEIKWFEKIIQFQNDDKMKKIKMISEALDEFVQLGFLVQQYEVVRQGFRIVFLPFTDNEWKDMKNVKKPRIE